MNELGEHQFEITDSNGFQYNCRLTARGKVYCPCRRHLEFRLPCSHLCTCIEALRTIDPRMNNVSVNDKLWVAPFWTVKVFLQAHKKPARSHAVHYGKLAQQQLLPPVSHKPISKKKARRQRFASNGEEGQKLLKRKKKLNDKTTKSGTIITTKELVENSNTFRKVTEGGQFEPIIIDSEDDDPEGNEKLSSVWNVITTATSTYKRTKTTKTKRPVPPTNSIDLTEDFWSLSEQLDTHKEELVKLREENAVLEERNRVLKQLTDAKHTARSTTHGSKVDCERCTYPILMEKKK